MPRTTKKTTKTELQYTVEPSTLDEFAEEYLRLDREMASLKKRQADMKKAILDMSPKDCTTELPNGINIKRTTYASIHFRVNDFKIEHDRLYNQYCEDLEKEKVTIAYRKK